MEIAAWCFLGGWLAGVFLEYLLHWIMHRFALGFHIGHHREFFHLDEKTVARRTADPRMDIVFFLGVLGAASPLMLLWGWVPVLGAWGGAFWHVVIVYEVCHALMHYEALLPGFVRNARLFKWWKGCHYEHHFHSPAGNYCVTFPVLDWVLGTYVAPRERYELLPHPKLMPAGDGIVVPQPQAPGAAPADPAAAKN